jgi:hypothetical protein
VRNVIFAAGSTQVFQGDTLEVYFAEKDSGYEVSNDSGG